VYAAIFRKNQGLWPLYRGKLSQLWFRYELRCLPLTCIPWLGFFVDVNLFKATNKKAAELAKDGDALLKNISGALDSNSSAVDGLADEDSNLMVKLKFLTYKVRLHQCFQLSFWCYWSLLEVPLPALMVMVMSDCSILFWCASKLSFEMLLLLLWLCTWLHYSCHCLLIYLWFFCMYFLSLWSYFIFWTLKRTRTKTLLYA
jgi:hypothetical protein